MTSVREPDPLPGRKVRSSRTDGSQDEHSAGTWIDVDGSSVHLGRDDVQLSVTDYWDSPAGGRYPAAWNLSIPGIELQLNVTPVMADQELFTTVRYWEGAVDVRGIRSGRRVAGRGYVELTGYGNDSPGTAAFADPPTR